MIGYAGSGYKGMQINAQEKTIEGDLFNAFVKAGAISKANADDPKKSSLVRCARTDKGVHAAGNVISLKLIVEDPNTVQNINEHLPPQIRVWGIERTNGSFSCYQTCDSRWYEYLIPTFAFLPPHPESFLGKKLVESAKKVGKLDTYESRQEDVKYFWEETEENYVKPILDKLDSEMAANVMAAIHSTEDESKIVPKQKAEIKDGIDVEEAIEAAKHGEGELPVVGSSKKRDRESDGEKENDVERPQAKKTKSGELDIQCTDQSLADEPESGLKGQDVVEQTIRKNGSPGDERVAGLDIESKIQSMENGLEVENGEELEPSKSILTPLEAAIKEVKAAYIKAKKAYRISESRRKRVEEALAKYVGTRNYHNYTIQKSYSDPSAKRVIRSFKVGKDPVIINDTEWLSLKVHGQSFMMHQIRKMVAMAALVIRCGTDPSIMNDSYGPVNISIPKAPGLGLLLERPVFDSYNEKAEKEFQREKIDFDKYQKEMDEFKQREIYDRIFREEERDHQYVSVIYP
jgi:tRNA pseudouridine38-40 synthase